MKKACSIFLIMVTILCVSIKSSAQAAYPYDRPLNIIVPFGPGGSVDIISRILSDYFLQEYNIRINVINKPGGAQAIAMSEVLRARPDGYTIVFPTFSALATTPKISNVGYTLKNFKPIAQLIDLEPTFTVHKNSPINNFADFIEAAKKDPANTMYATTAAISIQRLYTTKVLNRFHGDLKVRHVAYASNHEVSTALLGEHITMGCQVPSTVIPYVESGDFKPLAISKSTRHPALPNTPTIREIYADQLTPEDDAWIDMTSWGGLLFSAKVPDERVEALLPLFKKAFNDPKIIDKIRKVGIEPIFLPPAEFQEVIINSSNLVDQVLAGRKTLD